jgi:hypothetical protein
MYFRRNAASWKVRRVLLRKPSPPQLQPSTLLAERGSTQPEPAQVLHASGEREGGRVDGGRRGVPPQEAAQGNPVGRQQRLQLAHPHVAGALDAGPEPLLDAGGGGGGRRSRRRGGLVLRRPPALLQPRRAHGADVKGQQRRRSKRQSRTAGLSRHEGHGRCGGRRVLAQRARVPAALSRQQVRARGDRGCDTDAKRCLTSTRRWTPGSLDLSRVKADDSLPFRLRAHRLAAFYEDDEDKLVAKEEEGEGSDEQELAEDEEEERELVRQRQEKYRLLQDERDQITMAVKNEDEVVRKSEENEAGARAEDLSTRSALDKKEELGKDEEEEGAADNAPGYDDDDDDEEEDGGGGEVDDGDNNSS